MKKQKCCAQQHTFIKVTCSLNKRTMSATVSCPPVSFEKITCCHWALEALVNKFILPTQIVHSMINSRVKVGKVGPCSWKLITDKAMQVVIHLLFVIRAVLRTIISSTPWPYLSRSPYQIFLCSHWGEFVNGVGIFLFLCKLFDFVHNVSCFSEWIQSQVLQKLVP